MGIKNPVDIKHIKFKEGSTGTTVFLYTKSKRVHDDYLIVKPSFLSKCNNPKNMSQLIEKIEYIIGPLSATGKDKVRELWALQYPIPEKI